MGISVALSTRADAYLVQAKLEKPEVNWDVGWSCGKETLKNGRYDILKGSYYVNPMPAFEDPSVRDELEKRYPNLAAFTAPNVWPSEDVLPGFRETYQKLCALIIDTAVLVARQCDRYAEHHIGGYQQGFLEHVVKTSVSTKSRLLHYFPSPPAHNDTSEPDKEGPVPDEDDWCATHVDLGCLTGLTSAMFVDEAAHDPAILLSSESRGVSTPLPELPGPPDPNAGLYIKSRNGTTTKVNIPRDCLAFQTGESLEQITQGRFKAVPHFVRGVAASVGGRVARNTLAVFTQPNLWERVDDERDFAAFAREVLERNL